MLAKLMRNPSIRDSCNLIDIINACVKENTYEYLLINNLEACLLGGTKINKFTEAEDYEKVLDKSRISSDQSFEILMTQSEKYKKQEP